MKKQFIIYLVHHVKFRISKYFIGIALYAITNLPPFGEIEGCCQNISINASGAAADLSAMLDLSAANKGLLIPRVALASATTTVTIASPAASLLVYNDGSLLPPAGYYYNSGTAASPVWVQMLNGGSPGTAWLLKGNASITNPAVPATYGTSTITATENWMGTTDGKDIVFGTSNLERMRILSTGLIGIGTAAPTNALSITGNQNIAGTATTGKVIDITANTLSGAGIGLSVNSITTNSAVYTGNLAYFLFSHTYQGTGGTESGNMINVIRRPILDPASSGTFTQSGALMRLRDLFVDNTFGATALVHTANVLSIEQSISAATGAVLSITNNSVGPTISMTAPSAGLITSGATLGVSSITGNVLAAGGVTTAMIAGYDNQMKPAAYSTANLTDCAYFRAVYIESTGGVVNVPIGTVSSFLSAPGTILDPEGSPTNFAGFNARGITLNNVGGTITNYYGLNFATPVITAGAITNVYGINIDAITAGTNRYGIVSGSGNKNGFGTVTPKVAVDIVGGMQRTGTIASYGASTTVTAAELAGGTLANTGGTISLTLPTATNVGTQLGATAGSVFDFVVQNSAGSGTVTIVVNTGITAASALTGGTTLTLANSATVGMATFRLTFISATIAVLSRIS